MGSFVQLSCLLTELQTLECKKWLIFLVFCCWHQKINHSLGKINHSLVIKCYISFLYFKTFKIQHVGVSPLHYVLVCKIHICLPNKKNFMPATICILFHIQISLDTKFQLKLTNLICWTKFALKGYFQSKIEKVSIAIELCLFELVQVPNFSLN